jgi:NitT/TauT family transport system permease protein
LPSRLEERRREKMRAINIKPDMTWRIVLACLPFLLLLIAYVAGSDARLSANPNDKLLPSFKTMGEALSQYALSPDARTGVYLMWSDTAASLVRLLSALAISTTIALVAGIVIGLLPVANATLGPIVSVASMVPPLALLPILFIIMGLGEASKITLIVIGTTLKLVRDLTLRVQEIPREQIIKAQTLGASTWQIAMRVVLPQMLPRLIDAVRLEIGPAWLFLIAAEAIAADSGLGYRIFLVRRYLSMDVIIPYVVWITLLAFMMDLALRVLQRKAFPWFAAARST